MPSGGPPSLSFYGSNSTFSDLPAQFQVCQHSNSGSSHLSTCYDQAQNPTILRFSNGDIGVGYSVYTNQSPTSCTGSVTNTLSRVAFATSVDSGRHFTGFSYVGNDTCAYLQATEPSFALSTTGELVTAFVEENKSTIKTPVFPPGYVSRTVDALGFASSYNRGASWSPVVTLNSSGNITRPVVAEFGSTVYVVYENTSNTSTTYPGGFSSGNFHAIGLHFLRSTDGGVHWAGPFTLPGENMSMGFWAVAPSITVNATGTLAIAYATNRSCVFGCASPGAARYGDDVVVITSRTNGSTWSPLHRIQASVGESHCWSGYNGPIACFPAPFEWTPQTSIAFSPNGSNLYVAWAGAFAVPGPLANSATDLRSGVFVGSSTSSAVRWKTATIQANTNGYTANEFYLPAVGVAPNGTVFVTYTEENNSACNGCSGFNGAYSQWVVHSADGVVWSEPSFVNIDAKSTGSTAAASWSGWSSSVGFTSTGTPLLSYALPFPLQLTTQTAGSITYYNYSYPTQLSISYPYLGPTITLNVTQGGLAQGAPWTFFIDGAAFNQTVRSVKVPGIPANTTILIDTLRLIPGFWTQIAFSQSVPSAVSFSRSSTVFFNFTELFGLQFIYATNTAPQIYISFTYNTTYYYDNEYRYCYTGGCNGYHNIAPAFPWYFPAGTMLHIVPNAVPVIGYWNGTGNGSYTGTGSQANLTMDSPINETLWAIAAGVYNESFTPTGLPATSVFSFRLGETNYSAPATGPTTVTGLVTGAYGLSDIQANSSASGWEYFGVSSVGATVIVPAEPTVNLSFAYVDVAMATGPVSFHALGFTNGTVWDLTFNGTTYSSFTPWINLSARPGTYPWGVGAGVLSSNDSVGYTPLAISPRVTVSSGATVNVSFAPAYRVEVFAGVGGAVTQPGVHWLASGSVAVFNATPIGAYSFVGWTGVGSGNYTGTSPSASVHVSGPLVETASFAPLPTDRFNVTFTALGLAPNVWWSVFLNGVGYATNQMNLTVNGLYSCSAGTAGTYSLIIPYAYANDSSLSRFVPGHYAAKFCVNGVPPPDVVQFTPQYTVGVQATLGGTVSVTVGSNQSSSSLWAFPSDFVQIQAFPSPGYLFVNWTGLGSGAYTGPTSATTISPSGAVTELAMFTPVPVKVLPLYTVHFLLTTPLALGTVWAVTLAGVGYSSNTAYLNLSGFAPTSYPLSVGSTYSPDNLTRYLPIAPPNQVNVRANTSVPLSFGRSYWVEVSGSAGGTVSGGDLWAGPSASVSLNATPSAGFEFVGWTGSGPGNYTGTTQGVQISVSGPITERAVFVPIAPVSSQSSSIWAGTGVWAGLLVAGLAAGVVAGYAVSRRSAGRTPSPPTASGGVESAPEPDGEASPPMEDP
ncbi:MAG: hypothetical protein L3K19_02855 [Thermoplasmata archaeon]|nr:hypothetical protein [Thermoplasmata archaeon]